VRRRRLQASLVCLAVLVAACGGAGTSPPSAATASPSPTGLSPSPVTTPVPTDAPASAFLDWNSIALPDPSPHVYGGGFPYAIVSFHGSYIAVGTVGAACCADGDPSMNWGVVWTSADGRTWTLRDKIAAFVHASPTGLVTDGIRLLAFGDYAAPVAGGQGTSVAAAWVSTDGLHWTRVHDPAPAFVAVGPHGFVGAVVDPRTHGGPSFCFVASTDGLTWTDTSKAFAAELRGLAVGPAGDAMAVGDAPPGSPAMDMLVWRSPDGLSWSDQQVIAHATTPLTVVSGQHAFFVLVSPDRPQVWSIGPSGTPQIATIEAGIEGLLSGSLFVVGEAVLATGTIPSDPGGNEAAVWVSTDGGLTFGRVPDQPAFVQTDTFIRGVVPTASGLLAIGSRWDGPSGHPVPWVWLASR
jgi:hypothetical protein